MATAYSYDLRKRAMEALDEGESRQSVAARFKIGATTLYEWQQRRKETGDFISRRPGGQGYGHKITDWDRFTRFAQEHGHRTQAEMASLWHVSLSRQTIHRALKKIGFTRKKRLTVIKKETK